MISCLALSNSQLDVIIKTADRIAPRYRSRFLDAVADQLLGLVPPNDAAVCEAVRHVAERFHVNVGGEHDCCP